MPMKKDWLMALKAVSPWEKAGKQRDLNFHAPAPPYEIAV